MKTKPAEITYVEGWSKSINPNFDYLNSLKVVDSHIEKGELYRSGMVWNYEGNLDNKDFIAIDKMFYSDHFRKLKDKDKFLDELNLIAEGKQSLTKTVIYSEKITPSPKKVARKDIIGRLLRRYDFIEQKPYWNESTNVEKIDFQANDELFGELETIIKKHGIPESAHEAQSKILEEAKNNGKYYSISDYLEFAPSNEITVFIDRIPKGTIKFISDERKRNSYEGPYKSEYYPTKILVDIDGRKIIDNRNMWNCGQDSVTLWDLDGRIRREILDEINLHEFVVK